MVKMSSSPDIIICMWMTVNTNWLM